MHIPLKDLRNADDAINSRKSAASLEAHQAMCSSIESLGLLQPLLVRQTEHGHFEVIDGNRRFNALKEVHDSPDYTVECIEVNVDNPHAAEMSLAANTMRVPIHPADQYETFASLIESGMDVETVAASFGIKPKIVRQQMKLGQVIPEVLSEYRDGQLQQEEVIAFAKASEDKQREIYHAYKSGEITGSWSLRNALNTKPIKSTDAIARAVTEEAYLKAGGSIEEDLFGGPDDVDIWCDRDIAMQQYNIKREQMTEELAERYSYWHFEIDGRTPDDMPDGYFVPTNEEAPSHAKMWVDKHGQSPVWAVVDEDLTVTDAKWWVYSWAQPVADKPKEKEVDPKALSNAHQQQLTDLAHRALCLKLAKDVDLVEQLDLISKIEALDKMGWPMAVVTHHTLCPHSFLLDEDEKKALKQIVKVKQLKTKLKKLKELVDQRMIGKIHTAFLMRQSINSELYQLVDVDINETFTPDATFFERLKKQQLIDIAEECEIDYRADATKKELVDQLVKEIPNGWLPDYYAQFRKEDLSAAA